MTDAATPEAAPTEGELPRTYDPRAIEGAVTASWVEAGAFAAVPDPDPDRRRYVVMMPLPNVTGALHMGHAMDNVMQDLLTRWHRMAGDDTLWQPGTDHAGIATQAVVEKRLLELEGKTRLDIGREALVARIWAWKDEYQARIVRQQQAMGCGCAWDRQRFTMDPVCSAAVREAFFRLFQDGLIYRGDRLVNWDCHLQTAVADDEIVVETVQGTFTYIRYPVLDPRPGEPDHVVVATTRPETMLGDTAVAVHPAPRAALEAALRAAEDKLAAAPAKERAVAEAEVTRLRARFESHLPGLEALARMAADGRRVVLPLLERPIPIVADAWAKPELGSGCVKITPAHDPNDHEVGKRHPALGAINILNPDGTLNQNAGPYAGLDRFVARKRVVADLEAAGRLEKVEERTIELGHSDRSKTPVEPYLSKQWFVRMSDVPGGVVLGRGTPREHRAAGLAQAAIDAASGTWRSPTGRALAFHPDARYQATYTAWLAEKRDWCISRQLWWGHRIAVWRATLGEVADRAALVAVVREGAAAGTLCGQVAHARTGEPLRLEGADHLAGLLDDPEWGVPGTEVAVCIRDERAEATLKAPLEALGLARDPDVLDTWFSSALWPFSTLGWPDAARAPVDAGQPALGARDGRPSSLDAYYPGSCLVTGRDIITLWVARMVMLGLHALGDLPFTDVFVHANIQDGKGVRMSKTAGNGIDPLDIIAAFGADAMRYVLCDMQTGTQDIRLPVQAISPFTGKPVELATAKQAVVRGSKLRGVYEDPDTREPFDVIGTYEGIAKAATTSDRFEVGRNFCNKLWNAARFALLNLPAPGPSADSAPAWAPLPRAALAAEDRWILGRLARGTALVTARLEAYDPSGALGAARELFWGDVCDWYLELIKPRLRDEAKAPVARQVLAFALDQVLRLLHPFVPFVTEALWAQLGRQAPARGITGLLPGAGGLLARAPWPVADASWEDAALEAELERMREVTRAVRDLRAKYGVPPSKRLDARVKAPAAAAASLAGLAQHVQAMAGLATLEVGEAVERPRNAAVQVVGELEVYLADVLDPEKERARLEKQREQAQKQLAALDKKLGNEAFVARAPAEVVAAERARQAELQAQLAGIEQGLACL